MTGIVRGHEITTNRNSSQKVLMLQVEISSPDDIQLVEFYNPGGTQFKPPKGSIVQILQNGSSWKVAVSANDGIDFDESLGEGEKLIYGKDKSSTVKMLADGTIEINGNSDNAVRYQKLEDQIAILNSKFDLHVHPDPSSGTTGPPTNAPLNLDISLAKVDEVKLP